ncbi:HAMP domain-containing sensor histidine kinase [Nocardia sp. CDC153]|uniref:sensor histidine kinase n=1 Tax=Nocardia sp. CDC153 TaxID=3112167 RepID=UPI002DBC74A5|nr:HAMP domain-containing sensor histidine kinase [Nocardia sp. CDC153]MEC3956298.1 HAMP domain-containing sensor histidine kinase [Nocardia sp. CDC153]
MRRRLLIALTVFATVAVLAFAVPLCLTAATSRTQALIGDRTGDADRFAALTVTADRLGDHRALAMEVQRYHDLYGEPVLIVDARGAAIVNAGVDPRDIHVAAALAAARRNQRPATVTRLLPWSPATALIARPVGSDLHVDGAVLIAASTTTARTDITRVWVIVAVGALAAMAVFTGLALVLSRWVLRPLARLSGAVAELTASLPKPRTPAIVTRRHGGPPELRAVAESVDSMAAAVRDSTRAQRRLVDDTAHAMRNPLAALTIRLDSLEPAIPDAAVATFRGATREVERLTGLLDGLLTLAVAEGRDFDPTTAPALERCDAVQVVRDRIDAWHNAFDDADMTLTLTPTPDTATTDTDASAALGSHAETAVSAEVLAQILDVPLSNACRYAGAGTHTRVAVTTEPGWVRITVTDNGPGVAATELDQLTTRFFRGSAAAGVGGSGLGLPIAQALVTARHGTLTVETADPHGLAIVIRLPALPGGQQP